mmetsp:Transcript_33626/g.56489  ORF Transcript_33626/g.56489 Transcript_33626/m.56489 type:complete len:91 (+) Transcript_33626:363-635(+)
MGCGTSHVKPGGEAPAEARLAGVAQHHRNQSADDEEITQASPAQLEAEEADAAAEQEKEQERDEEVHYVKNPNFVLKRNSQSLKKKSTLS